MEILTTNKAWDGRITYARLEDEQGRAFKWWHGGPTHELAQTLPAGAWRWRQAGAGDVERVERTLQEAGLILDPPQSPL